MVLNSCKDGAAIGRMMLQHWSHAIPSSRSCRTFKPKLYDVCHGVNTTKALLVTAPELMDYFGRKNGVSIAIIC